MNAESSRLGNPWTEGLPRDVIAVLPPAVSGDWEGVERWLFGEGRRPGPVQRYISFLKRMHEAYHAAAELFDLWSEPGSDGSKHALRLSLRS